MASGAAGVPRRSPPDFLVTPYLPDLNGVLQPLLPTCGPCGGDGKACRLSIHVRRERTFGPALPLATLRCRTHRRLFTAYPPGWLPYKRLPLLHVDARGEVIEPPSPDTDPRAGTCLELPSFPNRSRREADTDNEQMAARRRSESRARARRIGFLEHLLGLHALSFVRERIAAMLRAPLFVWMAAVVLGRGRLLARREQLVRLWEAVFWGPGSLWRWMAAGELSGVFGKAWIAWPVEGGVTLLKGAASVPFWEPG